MKVLKAEDWLKKLKKKKAKRDYLAMYSSWAEGIVTDIELMMVPIDDHIVHRGDGVFEALQYTPKGMFELDAHVERLFRSAQMIGLEVPATKEEVKDICQQVAKAAGKKEGQLRIYVSRGPGNFTPDPYSTMGSQLYVVAMPPAPERPDVYTKGVSAAFSKIPVKPFPYAQIKSCNYLQNVMTKKEAIDNGVDYSINITAEGEVAEGPTENVLVWTSSRDLVCPPFEYTLRGTTLMRVMQLGQALKEEFELGFIGEKILEKSDLQEAKEMMMVGTTLGVCPVVQLEGKPVGDGKVGSLARRLQEELEKVIG